MPFEIVNWKKFMGWTFSDKSLGKLWGFEEAAATTTEAKNSSSLSGTLLISTRQATGPATSVTPLISIWKKTLQLYPSKPWSEDPVSLKWSQYKATLIKLILALSLSLPLKSYETWSKEVKTLAMLLRKSIMLWSSSPGVLLEWIKTSKKWRRLVGRTALYR